MDSLYLIHSRQIKKMNENIFSIISDYNNNCISISGLRFSEWDKGINSWRELSCSVSLMIFNEKMIRNHGKCDGNISNLIKKSSMVIRPVVSLNHVSSSIVMIVFERVTSYKLSRYESVLTLVWQENGDNNTKSIAFKGCNEFDIIILELTLQKFGFENLNFFNGNIVDGKNGIIDMSDGEIREIICDPDFEKIALQVDSVLSKMINFSNNY